MREIRFVFDRISSNFGPALFLFVVLGLCSCGVGFLQQRYQRRRSGAVRAQRRSLLSPCCPLISVAAPAPLWFVACGCRVVGDRGVQVVASKRTGASSSSLCSAVCRPSARALSCAAASSPTVRSPLFSFCPFLVLRRSAAPPFASLSLFSLCVHCVLVLFVAVRGASGFRRSHRNGYWSPPSGSGSLLRAPLSTGFTGQVPREALVQFVSFLD